LSVRHRSWKKKKKRDGEKEQTIKIFSSWKDHQQNSRNLLFFTYLLTYLHQTKTTQQTKTKQHGHSLLPTSKYRENTQERKQNKIGTWQKKKKIYVSDRLQ
jgi:hypothetical protein